MSLLHSAGSDWIEVYSTLNIPAGPTGATGPQGLTTIPAPTAISPLPGLATAYQVSKTSMVSVCADVQYTVTALGTKEDIVELRIGPDNTVATGGGMLAASWRSSLTGITLAVGMGAGDRGQMIAMVPAGWYWALRRTTGTDAKVSSALLQQLVP